MYDYQKDLKQVVNEAVAKHGSLEVAIFEMNGMIKDLQGQVDGKDALLQLARNNWINAINYLKSVKL
tara:strand:+ start:211 stop:411 length:201 start_codon:yes stop_codon:yes gene_type:complete